MEELKHLTMGAEKLLQSLNMFQSLMFPTSMDTIHRRLKVAEHKLLEVKGWHGVSCGYNMKPVVLFTFWQMC